MHCTSLFYIYNMVYIDVGFVYSWEDGVCGGQYEASVLGMVWMRGKESLIVISSISHRDANTDAGLQNQTTHYLLPFADTVCLIVTDFCPWGHPYHINTRLVFKCALNDSLVYKIFTQADVWQRFKFWPPAITHIRNIYLTWNFSYVHDLLCI